MQAVKFFTRCITRLALIRAAAAASCEPALAFSPPLHSSTSLAGAFANISATLSEYFSSSRFDATNVAIEVTSSQQTLWRFFRAAKNKATQSGASVIDSDTVFRITRNSKIFTALAILRLHVQGRIASLDNSIASYISGLEPSPVDWSQISIWDIMNNMGGILDMYGYADILTAVPSAELAAFGLPPVTDATLASMPACELNKSIPCDAPGLLSWLRSSPPVLAPHIENSNSNVGYSLLGLLIANVTGMSYEEYICQSIIVPMGLNSTGFTAPNQRVGAVPSGDSLWSWDVGVNNPSVGMYSSSGDMSVLLRWILNNHNDVSPTTDWFTPGYYAAGSHSFIGIPWNIFRTTSVLPDTNRPTTFNTVVGTLGSYTAVSAVMPDYDLALVLMMSGGLGSPHQILGNISFPLIQAAEQIAQNNLKTTYAGMYVASAESGINSSITLSQSSTRSLYISNWISNSTSILPRLEAFTASRSGAGSHWYFQLAPTFLEPQKRESPANKTQIGEVWRWTYVLDAPANQGWNDWCLSSFDPQTYAGQPLTRMTFWKDEASGEVGQVELGGFNITLTKKIGPADEETSNDPSRLSTLFEQTPAQVLPGRINQMLNFF